MKHSHPTTSILKPIAFLLASLAIAQGADSDFDGLDDAVETNTGVYVSPSDTGTTPGAADSDGDGVPDGLEVKEETSPVDATKFNSFSKGLLAYYPFNGNSNDESGFRRDGVATAITYNSDFLGHSGKSAFFTTGSAIDIPDLTGIQFRPTTYCLGLFEQRSRKFANHFNRPKTSLESRRWRPDD